MPFFPNLSDRRYAVSMSILLYAMKRRPTTARQNHETSGFCAVYEWPASPGPFPCCWCRGIETRMTLLHGTMDIQRDADLGVDHLRDWAPRVHHCHPMAHRPDAGRLLFESATV